MKRKMGWAALMILSLLPGLAKADDTPMEAKAPIALTSPSAILCEVSTGRVVFEKNADERRPVASVKQGDDDSADAGGAGRGACPCRIR
ncbi:MAG: hypothetical protein ACLUI3_04715 [Christensenellales bacterium]